MKLPGCCNVQSGLRAWCRELRFDRCPDGFPLPLLLLQISLAACLQVWVGPVKEVPATAVSRTHALLHPVLSHSTELGDFHPPAQARR